MFMILHIVYHPCTAPNQTVSTKTPLCPSPDPCFPDGSVCTAFAQWFATNVEGQLVVKPLPADSILPQATIHLRPSDDAINAPHGYKIFKQ